MINNDLYTGNTWTRDIWTQTAVQARDQKLTRLPVHGPEEWPSVTEVLHQELCKLSLKCLMSCHYNVWSKMSCHHMMVKPYAVNNCFEEKHIGRYSHLTSTFLCLMIWAFSQEFPCPYLRSWVVVSLRSLLYTNLSSLPITVEQICVIIKILFVVWRRPINIIEYRKSYLVIIQML